MTSENITVTVDELVARAERLAGTGRRCILGIVGTPGAGKSTIAARIVDALGDRAVLVPMDGYHLANEVLIDLGRRERKGAPDTFDAYGYISLLRRLADQDPNEIVYAPKFHREIEESFGSELPIPPDVPLVVTEGNYLLLDDEPWCEISALLDESWFLEPDEELRMDRLIARHMEFGKTEAEARAWSTGSDENNAEIIRASAPNADLIITVKEDSSGT